jgi:hypothetical protein
MKNLDDAARATGESEDNSAVAVHERSQKAKVIITGTGRAGTTFLVQLLTELGFDTGYSAKNWQRDYDQHCSAGLERDPGVNNTPRIIKNPSLCETLPGLLSRGEIAIEHAIIPIRALDEAAHSRIRVGGSGQTPGGLWGTPDATQQKGLLAENFHRLVHTLVVHEIPYTFLAFPRFARDSTYTWQKLQWLLDDIDEATFSAAFAKVARPELIHNFASGVPADAGAPARHYAGKQRAKRLRRRAKRVLVWGVLAGALWFMAVWR